MFTNIIKELLETKIAECNEIYQTLNRWWIWKQQYSFSGRIKEFFGNINLKITLDNIPIHQPLIEMWTTLSLVH